ncbi:hypothetical protein [Legionella feeleii]|uniref:Interaptin n=1 Tax=Legionella feeleii TaxID=453 RepID=A0A378IV60_9GAMM|nr:hypothetical protein [Legionella feeleii]STX38792.1 interaptin [Legionella feeleii]
MRYYEKFIDEIRKSSLKISIKISLVENIILFLEQQDNDYEVDEELTSLQSLLVSQSPSTSNVYSYKIGTNDINMLENLLELLPPEVKKQGIFIECISSLLSPVEIDDFLRMKADGFIQEIIFESSLIYEKKGKQEKYRKVFHIALSILLEREYLNSKSAKEKISLDFSKKIEIPYLSALEGFRDYIKDKEVFKSLVDIDIKSKTGLLYNNFEKYIKNIERTHQVIGQLEFLPNPISNSILNALSCAKKERKIYGVPVGDRNNPIQGNKNKNQPDLTEAAETLIFRKLRQEEINPAIKMQDDMLIVDFIYLDAEKLKRGIVKNIIQNQGFRGEATFLANGLNKKLFKKLKFDRLSGKNLEEIERKVISDFQNPEQTIYLAAVDNIKNILFTNYLLTIGFIHHKVFQELEEARVELPNGFIEQDLIAEIEELRKQIKALTDERLDLLLKLEKESLRASSAELALSDLQSALQAGAEKAFALEKAIEEGVQVHAQQVQSLEDRINLGEYRSGDLQRELDSLRTIHERELNTARDQLTESAEQLNHLSKAIASNERELSARQKTIDELREEIAGLNTTAESLVRELENASHIGGEAQELLRRQLSEEKAALVSANELASTRAASLEEAAVSNHRLEQQVDEFSGKNRRLLLEIDVLNEHVNVLTHTGLFLIEALYQERVRASSAESALSDLQSALQAGAEKAFALEKAIEEGVQVHAQQVQSLEDRIILGEERSGDLQRELDSLRTIHERELNTARDQLTESAEQLNHLSKAIASNERELSARQKTIDELREEIAGLNTTAESLVRELENASHIGGEAQELLRRQLSEEKAALVSANELASTRAASLEEAAVSNHRLEQQVDGLVKENKDFLNQIKELTETAVQQNVQLQMERKSKEEQLSITTDNFKQLDLLQKTLGEVCEQKALFFLKYEVIRNSRNLNTLIAFADAGSNADLLGHGFDIEIQALKKDTAYEEIKDEAELRLTMLTMEAKSLLIEEVNTSSDINLLERIARSTSNFDLAAAGLNNTHLNLLSKYNDFMEINEAAQSRLAANRKAVKMMTDFINGCDDVKFLDAISKATTNNRLGITWNYFEKDHTDHLDSLIENDAYKQFVKLAKERLLNLQSKNCSLLNKAHPEKIAQEKAIHALKREIANSQDIQLLKYVGAAKCNRELERNLGTIKPHQFDNLNLRNLDDLVDDNAYEQIRDAANARSNILYDARNKKLKAYANIEAYKQTLAANEAVVRKINRQIGAIGTVNDTARNKLRQLGKMNPMHWFNPAFRGTAKKNAIAMEAHFSELASTCKVIVDYLLPLRSELIEQIAGIPDAVQDFNPEHTKELLVYRETLGRYLKKVDAELDIYRPVYNQLFGDQRATTQVLREGILKMIQIAKSDEGAMDLSVFFDCCVEDYPMYERSSHFEKNYAPSQATIISARGNASSYAAAGVFKKGHFREYTTKSATPYSSGCYIEERASSYSHNSARFSDYIADVKLTITKFPKTEDGEDKNDPQLVKARMHFAFACAVTLLSAFGDPPTEANPIILRGFEETEMRYIWTALTIIGNKVPSMTFNHHAINVISPTFVPHKEMGRYFGYSYTSCYETLFKPNKDYMDSLLSGIKEACAIRALSQKELQEADRIVNSIASTYRNSLKNTVGELRENLDNGLVVFRR